MLTLFNAATIALLLGFIALYAARFRGLDSSGFSPAAAWVRACIFFCACSLISWLTGTQAMILTAPIITQAQFQDTAWISWTIGLTLFIFIGYWGVWAHFTMRFDRERHLSSQIPFGLLWGVSIGQLLLIIWSGVSSIGTTWPAWLIVLTAWLTTGLCFLLWMLFYWDLYIAPEHDSKYSIALKTVVIHVPQTLLFFIYVTLYNSFAILIALQTFALVGATIFMRMPPFWSKDPTPPARQHPFLFGLVYAGGYVSSDPKHDRYLQAAHLPY